MVDIIDAIIQDVIDNQRTFIPGTPCNEQDLIINMDLPILFDGLNKEDASLILSALPKGCTGILLSPMDKGLSGSKVFSARYLRRGRKSKPFIMKIGPMQVLEREAFALQTLACPHIMGLASPIFRKGINYALIVQEFAGLSTNSNLISLRQYICSSDNPSSVIKRIFRERFNNWYLDTSDSISRFQLKEIFRWYFKKIGNSEIYPNTWGDLKLWVEEISGVKWVDAKSLIEKILLREITSISSIVHGDLHSQNILVDEKGECWPIDFAWCADDSSPVVDAAMLECSLKFMAIPQHSDLRTMIRIETELCKEPFPDIECYQAPYCDEIKKAIEGVFAARSVAFDDMKISFSDYRLALFSMTYTISNRPKLNRPYALSSLQILAGIIAHE